MKKLTLGVAYHGNRLLANAERDMKDILEHNFNTVVHMFSHNDWDRSASVMKEIFDMTYSLGLDIWVDNWGLAGTPGDKSHFLCYHPEAHQIFSDGTMRPVNVCYNNPDFILWVKEWIDKVYECGGRKIFWDEPVLPADESKFACACPVCKKLFEERYNKPMPVIPDKDCYDFQEWSIVRHLKEVTEYSAKKGMENTVCVMLQDGIGINLSNLGALGELKTIDNIGCDPYWVGNSEIENSPEKVYKYVYDATVKNLNTCEKVNKDHNIWIQGFAIPRGQEDNIIYAADAAYDAGARNILMWGYRGSEGNDYRAKNPDLLWHKAGVAMGRLQNKEYDRIINEARTNLGLK